MKFICQFLLCALIIFPTLGATSDEPLPTEKIITVVKSYANAIGCFIHMDPNNMVRYRLDGTDVIVVLYSIDDSCSGGNAMHRPAFAALEKTIQGHYLIIPRYSLPSATSDSFPQFTNRLLIKDGELRYEAKEFNWGVAKPGEGDALCCPSLVVEGQVIFREGKWLNGGIK
jgi:hypothetical protein